MNKQEFLKLRNSQKREVAFVYNEENFNLMRDEFTSLHYFGLEANFIKKEEFNNWNKIFIVNEPYYNCEKSNNNVIFILNDINSILYKVNLKFIQYTSLIIKNTFSIELDNEFEDIIIPCYPIMKEECSLDSKLSNTIYFYGDDKPENMIDELLDLDNELSYNIKLYGDCFPDGKVTIEPSKLHKLSWNVNNNPNEKDFISTKILNELYNGCIPILLKENVPRYFNNYQFLIDLETLKNKEKLILRVKEIINFISSMNNEEFLKIADSIYKMVYYRSHWKKNFYILYQKIESLRDINSLV